MIIWGIKFIVVVTMKGTCCRFTQSAYCPYNNRNYGRSWHSWHTESSAIDDLLNVNPARSHKEVRTSTGHIMIVNKSGRDVSWSTSEPSASTPISGRLLPRTKGNGAGRWNKGLDVSWRNGPLQRKPGIDYSMSPNVTGRTKERIAQSKRTCAGSLALVD